jgi:hypothetical protein
MGGSDAQVHAGSVSLACVACGRLASDGGHNAWPVHRSFPGFTLMAMRGQISAATIGETTAAFDRAGMFQTGNQGKSPATFHVVVTEVGLGLGTLQRTLLTPFFFPLPTEPVLDGQIRIH